MHIAKRSCKALFSGLVVWQDLSHDVAPKDMHRACRPRTPSNLEESSCSFKPESPKLAAEDLMDFRSMSVAETENASNVQLSGSKAGGGHVFSNVVQKRSNVSFGFCTSYHVLVVWFNIYS